MRTIKTNTAAASPDTHTAVRCRVRVRRADTHTAPPAPGTAPRHAIYCTVRASRCGQGYATRCATGPPLQSPEALTEALWILDCFERAVAVAGSGRGPALFYEHTISHLIRSRGVAWRLPSRSLEPRLVLGRWWLSVPGRRGVPSPSVLRPVGLQQPHERNPAAFP